jgi:RES domain-containing protein
MPGGLKVWRICKQRHAATAFSGEGARLFAARWNPAGVPMVYTASSLSLAVVETFVNLDASEDHGTLVSIEATLPLNEADAERVAVRKLPADWRRVNHPHLQALGAEWARSNRSLILLVPSAAVEGEWNALVNPAHPDAAKIRLEKAKPFRFDPRMFKA